jgi:exopolyphosphatase/guanosine-5'-triphosphate,3'-diphosphate pyrophosphatase
LSVNALVDGSAPVDRDAGAAALQSLEGQTFAAADLGSNSFHMIVARISAGGLQVVDRLRDTVRLGAGLTPAGTLDPAVRDRALACLSRFGERLRGVPSERVRVAATNTVRQLRQPRAFLMLAETALGHPIEIVSGREEARLTHLGVAHAMPDRLNRRLVIDIGGGSTEFIIGLGTDALETESTQLGCVATTAQHFGDGKITRKRWQEVATRFALEVAPFRARFLATGWKRAIGTSGTMKATAKILAELGEPPQLIRRRALKLLVDRVIRAGEIGKLKLPGLSEERRGVIVGGLAIVDAALDAFGLEDVQISEAALREGLLYDLIGRIQHTDPREASVRALAQRFSVDAAQAERVHDTAMTLYDHVSIPLGLGAEDREQLRYAALLHEVGLAIAHSQHHLHGGYIVQHSDLAGFSRDEQSALALLVRCHRRKPPANPYADLPERDRDRLRWLVALLRIAVVLQRARGADSLAGIRLSVEPRGLKLHFPRGWLAGRPLTRTDLRSERQHFDELGLKLRIVSGLTADPLD